MKYSDKNEEGKKKLSGFLVSQAERQSGHGRDVFESTSKSVLLANTGGVVVVSSLLASGFQSDCIFYLKVAIFIFSLGVASFLLFKFYLSIRIGLSVKRIKQFHLDVIDDREDVSDSAVREKLSSISSGLEGSEPMWALGVSMLLFFVGIALAAAAIFQ
ncbi:MAG: hypothetical protein ACFE0K_01745 [Alcanivorax sp.]|uniref:hypothetical protein n=1 Tax=Alcanivorax sp. TaxID=1872427 RepID=UPI003DA74183